MIEYLISKHLGITRESEQYRHLSLVLISIFSCTGVAAFFSFYNLVIDYYLPLFYIDFAGALTGLLSLFTFLILKRILLGSFILLLTATGVCAMVIFDRGNLDYSLAWAFVCPILSVFLLGYVYGTLYSSVYLAIIAWFAWDNLEAWPLAPWDVGSFSNIVGIYLLLFILSCYYEASRRSAQRLLEKTNRKLLSLATTDNLTGLYNRRYIEDVLLSGDKNVFFAMVDVDNFKTVNDQYGHTVGDEVLVTIANILQSVSGENGLTGRWGGEEFAMIFYDHDWHSFEAKLEQACEKVAEYTYTFNHPVTVSIGGVLHTISEHKSALRAVDEALYLAKTSGKNRYKLAREDD